ncbi:hemerythrin domain-containing protein [Pseudothauera nasutitermitis]|uniref:Hemerythrin domain-containing protein n=1 Tax=Pseudothauera nasutitermitis TaxID=2565930 RepID=A0A4S4B2B4_9RHOO|nr:hemerythrin domain-containing protein [Pseudothauera nasutitermitis]THF65827.1 hemerythrin domain-containing protein [Pseudothauera nasutitermitis]
MNDSLISVAPSFDSPLEMLEACHGRVQAQLKTLARLAAWLPAHGADEQARQAAAAVMRYFDVAAVHHHMDEEEDLFPALLARVETGRRAPLQALIDWILADHQRMFAAWAQLRAVLQRIAAGEAAVLDAAQVEEFAARYQHHIEREEGELLPWARELLSAADMAALGGSMTERRRQPAG